MGLGSWGGQGAWGPEGQIFPFWNKGQYYLAVARTMALDNSTDAAAHPSSQA